MDLNELGYFLYMDAMEKKQKEDASRDPFNPFSSCADSSGDDSEDGEED